VAIRVSVAVVALVVIASGCNPAPCEEARPLEPALAHTSPTPVVVPAPVSIDPIGVAVCDDYVENFRRCIEDHAAPDAQAQMFEHLVSSAKAWRELGRGPAREFLDETCMIATAGARAATAEMGCAWGGERQF
jgi:hypothetical protein